VGVNLRSLIQHRIDLFELTLAQPEFHILVNPDGKTNFPSPRQSANGTGDFQISIQNFSLLGGSALVNERKIDVDFGLRNLAADLDYQNARQALAARLRYDGVFDRSADAKVSIPYTMAADLDYSRTTVIARHIVLTSGKNELKLEGR